MRKWRPKRDLVNEWTKWLKEHSPICQAQELWDIAQGHKRAKTYLDDFWNKNGKHFRKNGISKTDVDDAFNKVMGEINLYPYKGRKEAFFLAVHLELGKRFAALSSEETLLPLEDTEVDRDGRKREVYRGPVPQDEEDKMIDKIEPDLVKLRKEGKTIQEISDITGIPKSTVHRRLKKLLKE